MVSRSSTWIVVSATVAIIVLVSLAVSTPSMIFAQKVAIIDSELNGGDRDARHVLVKMDLGSAESLRTIPTELGPWSSVHEYDWDRTAEFLNTNVLLSRDYAREDVFQPVNLLIVQSTNVSSFHPAPVCYRVQGWAVEGDGHKVNVEIPNASWAQQGWLSADEPFVFGGNLSAKLLSVTKEGENGMGEQRVALYAYLKENDWRITREVTWIRIEITVPLDTDPMEAAPVLSSLFAEAVPHIFSLKTEEKMLWEMLLRS